VKQNYKLFCEGHSEFHYFSDFKSQERISIKVIPINMGGGGYSNFLQKLKLESDTNCLAKFIIIDADKACDNASEKRNLVSLHNYCENQNKRGRIPHILIINSPDFEYAACLHSPQYRGQSIQSFLSNELGYISLDDFKGDSGIYSKLNSNGNSFQLVEKNVNVNNNLVKNRYSVKKNSYTIKNQIIYFADRLGLNGSNIYDVWNIILTIDKNHWG